LKLLPSNTETSAAHRGVYPFAAFLLNKLPIYAEYAHICDDLPDWMREKYLEPAFNGGSSCWAAGGGVQIDGETLGERGKEASF